MCLPYHFVVSRCLDVVEGVVCAYEEDVKTCVGFL